MKSAQTLSNLPLTMMEESSTASPRVLGPGVSSGLAFHNRRSRRREFLELGARESLLYAGELRALFTEIAMFGDVVEASFKETVSTPPEPMDSLPRLFVALSEKRCFGAQIVYALRGKRRMDTLLVKAEGVICVRNEGPI